MHGGNENHISDHQAERLSKDFDRFKMQRSHEVCKVKLINFD